MNIAFKEWAVVCRALASGRQTVILRKGGIVEEGGEFKPDYPRFLLFPTYSHQAPDSVVPEARVSFEELEQEQPETGKVVFSHCASVTDALRVESMEALRALRGEHVWSDDVMEERFHRWRDHSIHTLIVRVYQLLSPVTIDLREEYSGCKSWVHLEEDIPVQGARPVIQDEAYERRVRSLLSTLEGKKS